jgi:hypothetical protein
MAAAVAVRLKAAGTMLIRNWGFSIGTVASVIVLVI